MRRAASSVGMLITGAESPAENHLYSASASPLNTACAGLPVRISPGHTVVTYTPCLASVTRIPSENPVRANLLAEYGTRCGTANLPPMDETLTTRPAPRSAIAGASASVRCSAAQKLVRIASS